MSSLDRAQANFIATINDGPDALDPELFSGPIDRVLLGLKAHANTISHARLVALKRLSPYARTSGRYCLQCDLPRLCRGQRWRALAITTASVSILPISCTPTHKPPNWPLSNGHGLKAITLPMPCRWCLLICRRSMKLALLALPVSAHPAARLVPTLCPLASIAQRNGRTATCRYTDRAPEPRSPAAAASSNRSRHFYGRDRK